MTRIVTLALVLSAAAAPAFAQETRIALAGKAPQAVYAEIQTSAKRLCRDLYRNDPFGPAAKTNCIRATVSDAVSHLPVEMAQAIAGEAVAAKGGGR